MLSLCCAAHRIWFNIRANIHLKPQSASHSVFLVVFLPAFLGFPRCSFYFSFAFHLRSSVRCWILIAMKSALACATQPPPNLMRVDFFISVSLKCSSARARCIDCSPLYKIGDDCRCRRIIRSRWQHFTGNQWQTDEKSEAKWKRKGERNTDLNTVDLHHWHRVHQFGASTSRERSSSWCRDARTFPPSTRKMFFFFPACSLFIMMSYYDLVLFSAEKR